MDNFDANSITSVKTISLDIYTSEEIRKISVKEIKLESGISPLRHVISDGIYDLAMGTLASQPGEYCTTCYQKSPNCPGHCGHIELFFPVINPLFRNDIPQLLNKICYKCHDYAVNRKEIIKFDYQNRLLRKGYRRQALEVPSLSNFIIKKNTDKKVKEVNGYIVEKEALTEENIHEKLSKYTKLVKKTAERDSCPTVHSIAIEREIISNFKEFGVLNCRSCKIRLLQVSYVNSQLFINNLKGFEESASDAGFLNLRHGKKIITPEEARSILRKCWENNKTTLTGLYPFLAEKDIKYPTDLFFISTLLVIPTQLRPFEFVSSDMVTESDISLIYKEVLSINRSLKHLVNYRDCTEEERKKIPANLVTLMNLFTGKTWQEKVHKAWNSFQIAVNGIYDSGLSDNKLIKGIRQRIERKDGLLRSNLMGKRVDYSARSLAAPDPYLNVDEIGVPKDFARFLSYPVPVTHWNASYLRKLVINGDSKYPGANYLELENGSIINLKVLIKKKRIAYAKSLITPDNNAGKKVNATKIVYRHLKEGDYVLINRQPTLHKPSIQAHKARITIEDKVLRMPYANCKAYNADFDGDEINLHFLQGEMARAEAQTLVSTHNNYLTPKDGSPLGGLIQDCVVAAVKMSVRGKFFQKKDYQQLVCNALWNHKHKIKLMPPTILKPQMLWSGKQILSTIMLNLIPSGVHKPTFSYKTAVKCEIWQTQTQREWLAGGTKEKNKESMTESEWVMRSGELLCGVVDKVAIGSTSYGLIHVCYELYGGELASKLMSAINRLCLCIMPSIGHTIGLIDFASPKEFNCKRRKNVNKMIDEALDLVSQKVNKPKNELQSYLKECHLLGKQKEIKLIESAYKTSFDAGHIARDNERALYRCSLDNNMKMMVDTGAKGSKINLNQMASLFGELTIDGKRIQMSAGGKTLPAFKPHDPNPLAGGYIKNRYISGMDCKSVFFLSMAGRDSLQHTAVKTANSGYTQRCLMKHLEGISVHYDKTVRNSDGVVLQFEYGEDGQDVCKMPFLNNYHGIDVIADNFSQIMDDKSKEIALSLKNKSVYKYKKKISKLLGEQKKQAQTGFMAFYEANKNFVEEMDDIKPGIGRSYKVEYLQNEWFNLDEYERKEWGLQIKTPDPVAGVYNGCSNLGSISEYLDGLIDQYYEDKYTKKNIYDRKFSKNELRDSLYMKVLHSKVDPGHPVGVLCAQSIGEPLTQMTLNTFHLAGQDDLNITLGVPRMIEILKTASQEISTPYMEIPFLPTVSEKDAKQVKCRLTPIPFKEIVDSISVTKKFLTRTFTSMKPYVRATIEIKLCDRKYCRKSFNLHWKTIQEFTETTFVNDLEAAFNLECKNVSLGLGLIFRKASSYEKKTKETSDDEEDLNENNDSSKRPDDLSDVEEDSDRNSEDEYMHNDEKDMEEMEEDMEERENGMEKDVPEEPQSSDGEVDTKFRQEGCFIKQTDFYKENAFMIKYTVEMEICINQKINMISIVKNTVQEAFVRSVANINQTVISEKAGALILKTDGVNFLEILKYQKYLDLNKFYTNNIVTMSKMYGIEAAQRVIIKEIRTVQDAYNITVDFRHLSLLADYFTSEGNYKACSRFAIANCASPIQSLTFEVASHVIKAALIRGNRDHMNSPSANILLGRPVKIGSNAMKILANTTSKSFEHNNRIFSHHMY